MNKLIIRTFTMLLSFLFVCGVAMAQETTDSDKAIELEKDILMGPGTVNIQTTTDIMMSYGARARIIPVSETDYDFGLTDDLNGMKLLGGGLVSNFFKNHITETGWVNNNYIRSEVQLYYTAMPKDKMWSFYAALEYDRPLENSSVDNRGGKDGNSSNFGLERLHGTFKLPYNMRLHADDIWGIDVIDAAGLVYGDDNPGFWVTGDYDKFSFNVGYFKLLENTFQVDVNKLGDFADSDRDLYGGYLTFTPEDGQKIQPFYIYDRIRDVPVGSLFNYLTSATGATPKTDSHHIALITRANSA
ncbi:hypothetical protein KAH55_12485 [bacterium]|nr:hypothetical protein [bacterium]